MRPLVSLCTAFEDEHLLAPLMGGDSREAIVSILLASQGEQLTPSELAHWKTLTLREQAPATRASETHIQGGRRSGKSSGTAALAIHAACLCDWSDHLQIGEVGVALVLAETQRQAKIMLRYITEGILQSPALAKLITGQTATSLTLNNRTSIEVHSSDFRAVRGMTLIMCCIDEIAMLRSEESANPDYEIVDAIRPGLVTTGGQLFTIGSPLYKRSFQHEMTTKYYKPDADPDIIVAKGGTRLFNETVSQALHR